MLSRNEKCKRLIINISVLKTDYVFQKSSLAGLQYLLLQQLLYRVIMLTPEENNVASVFEKW